MALDGVLELYKDMFLRPDDKDGPVERADLFMRHMAAVFSLEQPEEAG